MTDTPEEAAIVNQAAIDLLAYEKALKRPRGRPRGLVERKVNVNTTLTPSQLAYARLHGINLAAVLADFIEQHRTKTKHISCTAMPIKR